MTADEKLSVCLNGAAGKYATAGKLAEAANALTMLGFDKAAAAKALEGLDPTLDSGELVRLALKTFSK